MKCRGVRHGDKPCLWEGTRDGFCYLHHPSVRVAVLNQKRAGLVKQIEAVDEEIKIYTVPNWEGNPS